ncbi:MAG: deoxyribonuclease IV [Methanotrichaceae archaeon]
MVKVGVHVSIAGGIANAVDRASQKGCDVFQIFSRNPRGWRFKDISPEEADSFVAKLKKSGIGPAFDHMPYLPNLASPKEDVYLQSVTTLTAELHRCGQLHIPYLVTHLGSHLGSGREAGLKRLVDCISTTFSRTDNDVMLLLENTAGSKNSMGSSFEDIAAILNALDTKRLGVCLDTCHLFVAGYDLRTPEALGHTLEEFENLIGLERLRLIHLNDSKGDLGSGLDRHEHIGLGKIGEEGFKVILRNDVIKALPLILETPIDSVRDDKGNIKVARELASS